MKKASILLLFPLLLTLMGLKYNSKNVAIHDDWGSFIMELGKDKMYRASVKNGKNLLVIDREPPDCSSYNLTVQREADKYFANSFYIEASAQLRVDTNSIHEAVASVHETKGENTTFISIKIEESYRLYSELQNGNSIRIKLNVDGEEQIYEFSLDGSEAATQRAQKLCDRHTGTSNSDSKYFPSADQKSVDKADAPPVKVVREYYDALNRADANAAIKKWKPLSSAQERRLLNIIKGIEWFRVNDAYLMSLDDNTSKVFVDVTGKQKASGSERWTGSIELEKISGEWKISGISLAKY